MNAIAVGAHSHTAPNWRARPGLVSPLHSPSCRDNRRLGLEGNLDVQGCEGTSPPRKRKPRRRLRRSRKGGSIDAGTLKSMFWNARGIVDEVDEVIDFMLARGVSVAGVCESKTYGEELSRRGFTWLRGPETLPRRGQKQPRMGLGFLVRDKAHPNATVVETGTHTMWIRLQGALRDLYLCVAYAPVYRKQKAAALQELLNGVDRFQDKGDVLVGGDLNVRCAANGDKTVSTPGRTFMADCASRGHCIINHMPGVCLDQFSRVQEVRLKNGTRVTRQTTVDYALVPASRATKVVSLEMDADAHLNSDHRPLVVSYL